MIRRRVLARQLRLLREEAGLTLEQAAPKLDFSVSKLSRIENAQVLIDVHWVRGMLDLYDVGGDRWTELVELAREANQPGWWRAYGLGNNSYIAFETEASRRPGVHGLLCSGLMQTADYARALMRAVPLRRTAEQLENEVAARMYRQRAVDLGRDPLELVTVVDESALRRPVGGPRCCAAARANRRAGRTGHGDAARAARRRRRACRAGLRSSRSSTSGTSASRTWPMSSTPSVR